MTDPVAPVRVRIVTDPRAQVATVALVAVGLGIAALIARRRRFGPLYATKLARRMREWAQLIEDRGLDLARPKEES